MNKSIDFYYDYSSPYGYLASERIEALAQAHERTVNWCPILLGAVFKVTGLSPLLNYPLKGEYAQMDFERSAREHKLIYRHPGVFPIGAVGACRATLWAGQPGSADCHARQSALVHGLFHAYYQDGRDITDIEVLKAVTSAAGLDADAMSVAIGEPAIKTALKDAVDTAIARGVFGSPFMMVDGEAFWGHDRLEQMERWLVSGGW